MERISVIGGGAWGTALAQTLAAAGRRVTLHVRDAGLAEAISREHRNPVYLPDVALDPGLSAATDPAAAAEAELVLLVTPAQHLRAAARLLSPHLKPGVPAVICAKGIERGTDALMSEAVAEALPECVPAVLSGPTFAIEVARGLPTAVTLACVDEALGRRIVAAVGQPHFRPYWSADVTGAQIGGALKNVIAIACGIVEGRGLGDNARAALMTRGMAELIRYGRARGARPETLMGLSGLGDLTLTCNASQSRNMSLGIELGRGRALADVLAERRSVAEGMFTAAALAAAPPRTGLDLPICAAVDAVCNHGADIDSTIAGLLARPFRAETV